MINPEAMSREAFYAWFTDPATPTQADVDAWESNRLGAVEAERQAKLLAAWRATHPEATCREPIALLLAELEGSFGGRHV